MVEYISQWEFVNSNMQRLKVPGDWLIQVFTDLAKSWNNISISVCYYPDFDHKWCIKQKI